MIRIPPRADPDVQVAFRDVEQRLRGLETPRDGVSASALDSLRSEVSDLRTTFEKTMESFRIYASNVIYLPSGNLADVNVQKAIQTLAARDTIYDDQPQWFTLKPGAWLSRTSNFTHNSTGNAIQVTFDIANEDNNNMADITNSQLVTRTAGVYRLSAQIHFVANATGNRLGQIKVNSTVVCQSIESATSTHNTIRTLTKDGVRLLKGDTLQLWALQDSGGNLDMGAGQFWICAQWVRY